MALVSGPCAVDAQSPPAPVRVHPNYAIPVPPGPADTGGPALRLAVAAAGASHDYAISLSPARQRALTTTLDYRMSPNGPVGSIGFPAGDGAPYVDRAFLNPAASMGFVRPEVVVGGRISYRF